MTSSTDALIAPIEAWIEAVDAAKISNAPEDFLVGYGAVHRAIARLLETGASDHAPTLFTALAACEFVLAERPDFTEEAGLPPLQPLTADWLVILDDDSAEFRLAASLSALRPTGMTEEGRRVRPFRTHLEPVDYRFREGSDALDATSVSWDFRAQREVIWDKESDVDGLNAIFARRLKTWDGSPTEFTQSAIYARLDDIGRFIRGETDEAKLSRLCFSLSLVDAWRLTEDPWAQHGDIEADVEPAYALTRLCYTGQSPSGQAIPLNRDIHLLANRGDLDTSLEFARAHLRKHDVDVAAEVDSNLDARRVAASLLFPLDHRARATLAEIVT